MLSLDDYFSLVDCQGVNSEMYALIFSYFDQKFKVSSTMFSMIKCWEQMHILLRKLN